jgi:hypothetical protein
MWVVSDTGDAVSLKYDLELAAHCLFALAEGPRGEYARSLNSRRNTVNALHICLGATSHLSQAELEDAQQATRETKA